MWCSDSVEVIDRNDDYNSDAMDSDMEVELYSLIHHNTTECTAESDGQQNRMNQNTPITSVNETVGHNNNNDDSNHTNKNKTQPECIEISDSSDDSDNQSIILVEHIASKRNENAPKKRVLTPDLMLSNVDNLNDNTLKVMDKFYNEDGYNSEEEQQTIENMSDNRKLWQISGNDLIFSNKRTDKRYYRNGLICNNCSERGHISRDCPQEKKRPVCYLCGNIGHYGERCVSKICTNCLSTQHNTNKCKTPSGHLVCELCGQNGHQTNNCTYNWRKFHITTDRSLSVSRSLPLSDNLKVNNRVCCYNCGAYGKHFGHECRSKSATHYSYGYSPSPLMPTTKKAHCFNDKQRISPSDSSHPNGNISSNQLSSASVSSFTALSLQRSNQNKGKNVHIKWFYAETSATPLSSKSEKRVIGKHIFDNSSPIFHNDNAALFGSNSAHTPHTTHSPNAKIDNPMQANRQILTPKRSKRRRLASKQRRQLLNKTNENPNTDAILVNGRRNKRKVKRLNKFHVKVR